MLTGKLQTDNSKGPGANKPATSRKCMAVSQAVCNNMMYAAKMQSMQVCCKHQSRACLEGKNCRMAAPVPRIWLTRHTLSLSMGRADAG